MRATVRLIALLAMMSIALPAWAHGDHDARPLLRDAELGPYSVSLWQVYPNAGSVMTPLLIVMFDEGTPTAETALSVQLGSEEVDIVPSSTSPGAWETTTGLDTDDLITVTVAENGESWSTPTIMIPPPLTSMFPMRALIAISIFLATAVAWWIGGRTAQAWRRPITYRDVGLEG
jgi:hypothetical protein